MRGYEVTGKDTKVEMKFPLLIESANPTDLIEQDQPGEIQASGDAIQVTTAHRAINAIRIHGSWKP